MGSEDQHVSQETSAVWEILDEFDQEWLRQPFPRLSVFLQLHRDTVAPESRHELVVEIVMADLEHRWKRKNRVLQMEPAPLETRLPTFPLVEDYLVAFHDLKSDPSQFTQLVLHEYKCRKAAGEAVEPGEYGQRFPEFKSELLPLFDELESRPSKSNPSASQSGDGPDSKLKSVTHDDSPVVSPGDDSSEISREPPKTAQDLYQILEKLGLMSPLLWSRLTQGMASSQPLKFYFERLMEEGALTDYQADRIERGNARRLLVDDYLIMDRIGRGGMGVVYKAKHLTMERMVALKVLDPAISGDDEAVKRFQREIRTAAKLSHPNIVMAFDSRRVARGLILVMEFVDGKNLRVMVDDGALAWQEAVEWIRQTAVGMDYAHKHNIIHRDIKPANVLVEPTQNVVKILDLGLARLNSSGTNSFRETADLTATGAMMGTVDFMAPEQSWDAKHVDHRSDIYSLGCTLYFLVVGEPMYAGETQMKKIFAHRGEPIPDLPEEIPSELNQVYRKMVAKEPDQRYDSMGEVAQDLDELLRPAVVAEPDTVKLAPSASDTRSWRDGTSTSQVVNRRPAIDPEQRRMQIRRWSMTVISLVCSGIILWRLLDILGIFPMGE